MCDSSERLKLIPLSAIALYRKTTGKFKPGLQHVFELAILTVNDPVPGEIQLVSRLRKRFGCINVGIRKDAAPASVIRILSEPLMKARGKKYIAQVIAETTLQHYGMMVPVSIIEAEASICADFSPAALAA